MAIPKVMGIETEYGITVKNQPDFNPILSSLLLINSYETFRSSRVRWDYEAELRAHSGDLPATLSRMIAATIDEMYSLEEDNRFLEVTYANGDKEVLYFKDFASGAMIESIVRRAKKLALKRYIQTSEKGITVDDLLAAVREEFKENEDLPNTTNPDDWAKIAGKKGERIVYVKPLMGETKDKQRAVERVINTGQYL